MIQKIKNQDTSHNAFTLIEMLIVLIIIGIMLMATVFLSGEQIQKAKNKTVKESILAEMQSRYSRNLGSSSFSSGIIYDTMDVSFSSGANKIEFKYNTKDNSGIENTFIDRFMIMYIATDYDYESTPEPINEVKLKYYPYKISCKIGDSENSNNNVVFVARVNDNKDYCFEINQKNCRLVELSDSKCKIFRCRAGLDSC